MSAKTELPTVDETCETCRYYLPSYCATPDEASSPPPYGGCNRYPPVMSSAVLANLIAEADGYYDGSDMQTATLFPVVGLEDRCGEWQPKK